MMTHNRRGPQCGYRGYRRYQEGAMLIRKRTFGTRKKILLWTPGCGVNIYAWILSMYCLTYPPCKQGKPVLYPFVHLSRPISPPMPLCAHYCGQLQSPKMPYKTKFAQKFFQKNSQVSAVSVSRTHFVALKRIPQSTPHGVELTTIGFASRSLTIRAMCSCLL